MYKNILQCIDHIAIWPMVSFVIFILFFICLLWRVVAMDKKYINKMSGLPLEEPLNPTSSATQNLKS